MHRFFLSPENIQGNRVLFPEDISHQITRVLRLRISEKVIVLDNQGLEYEIELTQVENREVEGQILQSCESENEAKTRAHLIVGLTQREKFEWILQKGTELGVASFTPLITQRTLVQAKVIGEAKNDRWSRIIREAAEQSERGICPILNPSIPLSRLTPVEKGQLGLALWEEEQGAGIRSALTKNRDDQIFLVIGPEGGITPEEIEILRSLGYQSVSLGKRILRMETAAITAVAAVLFERGEMGI